MSKKIPNAKQPTTAADPLPALLAAAEHGARSWTEELAEERKILTQERRRHDLPLDPSALRDGADADPDVHRRRAHEYEVTVPSVAAALRRVSAAERALASAESEVERLRRVQADPDREAARAEVERLSSKATVASLKAETAPHIDRVVAAVRELAGAVGVLCAAHEDHEARVARIGELARDFVLDAPETGTASLSVLTAIIHAGLREVLAGPPPVGVLAVPPSPEAMLRALLVAMGAPDLADRRPDIERVVGIDKAVAMLVEAWSSEPVRTALREDDAKADAKLDEQRKAFEARVAAEQAARLAEREKHILRPSA